MGDQGVTGNLLLQQEPEEKRGQQPKAPGREPGVPLVRCAYPSPRPFPWLCQCGEVSTDISECVGQGERLNQLRAGPGLFTRILRSVTTTKQPAQPLTLSASKSSVIRIIKFRRLGDRRRMSTIPW